jgi:NADP-dependent 3-hydroxy acid dehydrogenase YdfG
MSKIVLITGGSSGIGKSIGEFLFHKGYTVYGTSRNPERITNSIFPLLELDVQNVESIKHTVEKVISICSQYDLKSKGINSVAMTNQEMLKEILIKIM